MGAMSCRNGPSGTIGHQSISREGAEPDVRDGEATRPGGRGHFAYGKGDGASSKSGTTISENGNNSRTYSTFSDSSSRIGRIRATGINHAERRAMETIECEGCSKIACGNVGQDVEDRF